MKTYGLFLRSLSSVHKCNAVLIAFWRINEGFEYLIRKCWSNKITFDDDSIVRSIDATADWADGEKEKMNSRGEENRKTRKSGHSLRQPLFSQPSHVRMQILEIHLISNFNVLHFAN